MVMVKQFVRLLVKDIENVDLLKTMVQVFDYTDQLHSGTFECKEYDKWRYFLKVGDRVEAVKSDGK